MEGKILLKDGRKIYTTKNGFEYWVETSKGEATKVSSKYFNKVKKHRVKL